MIYDYVNTKPSLEEVYIQHGWVKDAAAKAHKYIERWRGKNGKWYYRYKSKAQELGAKAKRTLNGIDPETPTKYGLTIGDNNGKANSHSGQVNLIYKNPKDRKARFDAGIAAGRKRATKKGYAVKGYRGKTGSNLSSRGYSRSNSPKATETLNFNGRKVSYDIYDQPSSFLNSPGYYRVKGKNDVFVSRGTNAGRKRAAKKKKK